MYFCIVSDKMLINSYDIYDKINTKQGAHMIKLFASDLDGTLFKGHNIDDMVDQMIREVIKAKKYFVMATGRQMHPQQQKDYNYDADHFYIIANNGATIYDGNQNLIDKSIIDPQFITRLMQAFLDVHFEFIDEEGTYIRGTKEEYLASHTRKWPLFYQMLETCHFACEPDEILKRDIVKINCYIEDLALYQKIDEFCQKHNSWVVNAPFDKKQIEITSAQVNKGQAIKKLARRLHIADEEVAVYGDGGNDLVMLTEFVHAYAPLNACEAAKKAAKKLVGSCEEHGVPLHILKTLKQEEV